MKTLLITGSTGFIGKRVVTLLRENGLFNNYRLVTLSSAPSDECVFLDHQDYTFTKELFTKNNVNKVDIVLHIGAFIPKSAGDASDINLNTSNIRNTIHLINNLPNIPEKFLFISTIDVYSYEKDIDENTIPNPSTLYGLSKLYCEKVIENWASENESVVQILRFGHIYGPGEEKYRKLIPVTIEKILNDENPVLYSKGDENRQFLYIDDVCRMILSAVKIEKNMGIVNIVSSRSVKIREIIEILIDLSGKKMDIEFLGEEKKGTGYCINNCKMLSILGEEQVTLEKGLKIEMEYLKKLYGKE